MVMLLLTYQTWQVSFPDGICFPFSALGGSKHAMASQKIEGRKGAHHPYLITPAPFGTLVYAGHNG
jgi:hypothetical protein